MPEDAFSTSTPLAAGTNVTFQFTSEGPTYAGVVINYTTRRTVVGYTDPVTEQYQERPTDTHLVTAA